MNILSKSISDGIEKSCILSISNKNGIILEANSHFCKLSGYSQTELIGKTHSILNSRHHRKEFFKDLWQNISKGLAWQGLICNKKKNGEYYWVNTTIQPCFDSNEKITYYLAVLFDVTSYIEDQRKLKSTTSELTKLKSALDKFAIVARTNSRGEIEYVNDKFCEISGYSSEELIGQDHRILNSGEHSKDFFKELWNTISSGKIWSGEIKNKTKLGDHYWVATTITPLFEEDETVKKSKPSHYVAIRKDITKEKKLAFEAEKEKALAMNRTKLAALGELSAGVAHEIGNPLNIIQGRAEMLIHMSEQKKIDLETVTDYSKIILKLCERMSKIINGLSSYSKDSSQDPIAKVNLSKILDEIISFSTHKLRNNKIEIFREGFNSSALIDAREAEIAQVITNLLTNACDALSSSDIKEITVRQGTEGANHFFEISDTGHGIPDSVRDSLYESFVTTKGINGTGLGLNLCRKIVHRYNVTISFTTSTGRGTCFRIEFPKAIL